MPILEIVRPDMPTCGIPEQHAFSYQMAVQIPLGRVSSPDEIAKAVVFLASDESKSISGTAIEAYGTSNPLFGEGKWSYVTE